MTVEQHLKRADKLLSDSPKDVHSWKEFDSRSLRVIAHMMMAEFKEKHATTNTE